MNLNELVSIIKHVRKNSSCPNCKKRYNTQNISILASTKFECLLELKCPYCKKTALTDIVATPKKGPEAFEALNNIPLINRVIRDGVTNNDILDVKNFLDDFDGNFEKLFHS